MLAVAEQESGYRADPSVSGLAAIAKLEIEQRVARAGMPELAARAALALRSPAGRSYRDRMTRSRQNAS